MTTLAAKLLKPVLFLMLLIGVSIVGDSVFDREAIISPHVIINISELLSGAPTPEDMDTNHFILTELIFIAVAVLLYALLVQLCFVYKGSRSFIVYIFYACRRFLSLFFKICLSLLLFLLLPDLFDYESFFDRDSNYAIPVVIILQSALSAAAYTLTIRCLRPIWCWASR